MQVPRYWRMKQHLYQLQGYVHENGNVTLDAHTETPEEKPLEVRHSDQPTHEQFTRVYATVA